MLVTLVVSVTQSIENLSHDVVHLKPTSHCVSTIPKFYNKLKERMLSPIYDQKYWQWGKKQAALFMCQKLENN